jgi:hypothetical protein
VKTSIPRIGKITFKDSNISVIPRNYVRSEEIEDDIQHIMGVMRNPNVDDYVFVALNKGEKDFKYVFQGNQVTLLQLLDYIKTTIQVYK